jgi:hypothetical protein
LWRERVRIALSPQQVEMLRFAPGWRREAPERIAVACAGTPERNAASWAPAIEALRELLTRPNLRRADATVILSNNFVRYLLIPWSASLVTGEEQSAFARMRFVQVYGEAAQSWMLRLSDGVAGSAQVAAAVERPLIDSLTTMLESSPLALRSIQPQFMSAFNAARKTIGRDAWLAIAEPGRLLLGLLRGGRWLSLRSRPLNGEAVALAELLDQERLMLGLEPGSEKIYLQALSGAQLDTEGLRVERLCGTDPDLEAGVQQHLPIGDPQ